MCGICGKILNCTSSVHTEQKVAFLEVGLNTCPGVVHDCRLGNL
jgi:hypothetical protein